MAERVAEATDPLNLMRVMPTQGGQPCHSVHGFLFYGTADYTDEDGSRQITRE